LPDCQSSDKDRYRQTAKGRLEIIKKHSERWLREDRGSESKYYRAIGSAEALMAKAAEHGQRWMQGVDLTQP